MVNLNIIDIGKISKTDVFYDGATDFAKLTGICEDESYWVIKDENKKALVNNNSELKGNTNVFFRNFGIRPTIDYDLIKSKANNIEKISEEIENFEYGEYPCSLVTDKKLEEELEENYCNNTLIKTGKRYTVDGTLFFRPVKKMLRKNVVHFEFDSSHIYSSFIPLQYDEYQYNDNKYIRMLVNSNSKDVDLFGKEVWIKVEPIKWTTIKSDDKEIAICNNTLLAGIQFDNYNERDYKLRTKYNNFKKTEIKKYIMKYLSKEILPTKEYLIQNEKEALEEELEILQDIKDINSIILSHMYNNEIFNEYMNFINNELFELKRYLRSSEKEELETIKHKLRNRIFNYVSNIDYDNSCVDNLKEYARLNDNIQEKRNNYKRLYSIK